MPVAVCQLYIRSPFAQKASSSFCGEFCLAACWHTGQQGFVEHCALLSEQRANTCSACAQGSERVPTGNVLVHSTVCQMSVAWVFSCSTSLTWHNLRKSSQSIIRLSDHSNTKRHLDIAKLGGVRCMALYIVIPLAMRQLPTNSWNFYSNIHMD